MSLSQREQELFKLGVQRGRRAAADGMAAEAVVEMPAPTARVSLPAPQVTNNIPAPVVNVTNDVGIPSVTIDTEPIAEALRTALSSMEERCAALEARVVDALESTSEMLSQLVRVFAEARRPVVRVEAPPAQVSVEHPMNRVVRIKHSDGTESVAEVA